MNHQAPAAPRPSRTRTALFLLVLTLAYALVGELVARGVFVALAGNALPLAYGFDRDIKYVRHASIRNPIFLGACAGCDGDGETRAAAKAAAAPSRDGRLKGRAFGGSTTFGRNCSAEASSWPDELSALSGDIEVVNDGRNGTNSDYAVAALQASLERDTPDVVFWANWINELDVIFEGPSRNRTRLAAEFADVIEARGSAFESHGGRYFLATLDKTLFEVSALYLLLTKVVDQLRIQDRAERMSWGDLGQRDLEFAIANTLYNLEAARRLGARHGFRLVIVRLPVSWPWFERRFDPATVAFVRRWDGRLWERVRSLAAAHDLVILDIQRWFERHGAGGELFCDQMHLWRPGHRLAARAIDEMLRQQEVF